MLPFLARTCFRLQERLLGRRTFSLLRQLEESQWWPWSRLQELQVRRLRRLLQVGYDHCPYWRGVMDEGGIRPDQVANLADLRRLPLLEKETIRAQRENMVWRSEGPRLQLTRTSGSTNEALQFYSNSNREAAINAARMRGHRWIGIEKGDKEMYFWGSPIELSKQDRVKRVRDFFVNDGLTNGFVLAPDLVPGYVAQWRRWRPRCIFGYPSSLVLLCKWATQQGIDLHGVKERGLEVICTTSEMLSDVDRRLISDALGVPVYDSYGLREAGFIGHECAEGVMHTTDEQLILETIDPDTLVPTAGEGELVVTSLISRVMPVIRYRTGDLVRLSAEPCPCGRSLHRVQVSGGRAVDFVVTDRGQWVAGYAFIYICRSVPGIVKFQVHQERLGALRVLLVTDNSFPPDGQERIAQAVRRRLDSTDDIGVEIVPDIQPGPSGKYRPVLSKVAQESRLGARPAGGKTA